MKKVTLITGAGRGIGKEIALKFGKENHLIIFGSNTYQENSQNFEISSNRDIL